MFQQVKLGPSETQYSKVCISDSGDTYIFAEK